MGYTKIVQYGDTTEIYEFSNERRNTKPKQVSPLVRKRQKMAREREKRFGTYQRSRQSIKRSREAFFRLCHHNNCGAGSIHFVTITFAYDITWKEANRAISRFFEKLKAVVGESPISYICVPEKTEEGRTHFHLLVYDLPTRVAGEPKRYKTRKGDVWYTTERKTRNIQRLFERGYIDVRPTTYNSRGIAGYMAKYMGKALGDAKHASERGYSSSRNIKKIYHAGGNQVNQYLDLIVPDGDVEKIEFVVPWLGTCTKTVIIKN